MLQCAAIVYVDSGSKTTSRVNMLECVQLDLNSMSTYTVDVLKCAAGILLDVKNESTSRVNMLDGAVKA